MNRELEQLQAYPFEKLRELLEAVTPADLPAISLGIGEPQHPAPEFVIQTLQDKLALLSRYPATRGIPELREAIAEWLQQRFALATVDADSQVLPVNGTREALFAFAQAVIDRGNAPLVLSPNPFYQIYEGAALLAGADLKLLNCTAESGFQPDFDAVTEAEWQRCQLMYICTPGNPTGAVLSLQTLQSLVEKAREYHFIIASDECYSEIYSDEEAPPAGLLQACEQIAPGDYRNCVVFHSLSKRSNLPGLRSGFVAGDAAVLQQFLQYRTYHGCAMPLHHQWASIAAWRDEEHVITNRALYRAKFDAVLDILDNCLDVQRPDAGFYLWPRVDGDDRDFARELLQQQNLTVLPGRYLAREADGFNPGSGYLRLALVAQQEECEAAAQRLHDFCRGA